jgi:PilZ domain
MTDMISEKQISSHTSDLSVNGCFVPTSTPLNLGAKVRFAIVYADAKVVGFGVVVSARTDGVSIAFTGVEQRDHEVLERWLS